MEFWAKADMKQTGHATRNYREEIELALAGGAPRHIPFTFYDLLFPPEYDPAFLQSKGMAICARRDVCRKRYRQVTVREFREPDGSLRLVYETPIGSLTSYQQKAALGFAPVEHPVKTRDDYRIAAFIARDIEYEPIYDYFLEEIRRIGDTGKVIAHTGYEPLMEIQVVWVGQEQFCYDLADHADAVMDLHDAIVKSHRQMYAMVARSPADYVLYGGNIVPEMLGPDRVRDLIAPCWDAFAARLHENGKKIGCHLDANNNAIVETIGQSQLDFVEAFTPPPDCRMSVKQARAAWPGKRLWINFPCSVHLASEDVIRAATHELVRQAGDRKGFLMGVTEDIPVAHINRSIGAILDVLNK